jgi:hypothetical protein
MASVRAKPLFMKYIPPKMPPETKRLRKDSNPAQESNAVEKSDIFAIYEV